MSDPCTSPIELLDAPALKSYQEVRLREVIDYVWNHSPYYRALFEHHHILPEEIRTLEDLRRIPTTDKEDLQAHNNDFLCVGQEKIIDYITTSGTMGTPVTFAMTDNDLERLAYNELLSFTTAGGSPSDIYQLMVTMDRRFMAGLAYFLGLRKMGAAIVRTGPGNPELQIESFERFKPTVLVTVPSFLLRLIDYADKMNIDLSKSSVKAAVCIGEPLRDENFELNTLGKQITKRWDIRLYSTYASTEMGAAFTECRAGCGGHHQPELLITEFLDDDENPVAPGEIGELTVTTLGTEGMPLIRFKSGDIFRHYTAACSCGRKTLRVGGLIGRKKQMIKYKGTSLYPPALYDILNGIKGIENYVVEVFSNDIGTDEILIRVGTQAITPDFENLIREHFHARLRVTPAISFSDPLSIEKIQFAHGGRKPMVFNDKRTNNL